MPTINFQPYAAGTLDQAGNRFGSVDPRLSRTNYFDGQLLKASDLSRDQIYLDERMLEMGQVLGSGVAAGLDVELLDNHILRVQPGIAVAPSGRVLQLTCRTLEINLQDSGFIATLNKGRYRRFSRGLYAIVLRYAEVVDGMSEAYPADLASRRHWQVSSFAEGVELALIPLNISLPRGDDLAIRAHLARQIIGHSGRFDLPTDEAIALGMLAIDQMRVQWLDRDLLRRPLRRANLGNALQLDLAAHYQELFAAVLTARHRGGRNNDFSANQYFRLLPPFGPLPKDAIDPVTGSQRYFPTEYDVSIAPVRREDVAAIIQESAQLAPLDLERDADADIMVLVPLSNQAFALRARQLEQSPQLQALLPSPRIASFSALALRLFRQPPAHSLDTDAEVWRAIWNELDPDELMFVRRPPRTAETNISAVVLARGFALPPLAKDLPPDPASLETQLDTALEDLDKAGKKLAALAKDSDKLKQQIKLLQQSLDSDAPLNDALAKLQKTEAALKAAKQEVEELKAGNQDSSTLKTALQAATDKIDTLVAELDLAQQKIAALQSVSGAPDVDTQNKIEQLIKEAEAANDKFTEATKERDAFAAKLAAAELTTGKLTQQVEQQKKQLEELHSGTTTTNEDLTAAQQEITKLKQQLDTAGSLQQTLEADLLKAQQDRSKAESDSKTALLQLADALKLTSEAQAESKASAIELNSSKEQIKTLQSQLEASDKSNSELKAELAQRMPLRNALPLTELAELRGGAGRDDAEKLEAQVGDNNEARIAVAQILMQVEPRYDKALWPSLVSVADNPKNLDKLNTTLTTSLAQGTAVAKAVPDAIKDQGTTLSRGTLRVWDSLGG